MNSNIFGKIDELEKRIKQIEEKLDKLELKQDFDLSLVRSNLVRIKNDESLSDDFIIRGDLYNDLSPGEAISLFSDDDANFVVLDVSKNDFKPQKDYMVSVKISLEELEERISELNSFKNTSLIIISENGLRSIKACETLIAHGFYNLNNVSGGYDHLDSALGI